MSDKISQAAVVLCTCPSEAGGRALAKVLLGQNLAACVNLLPAVTSLYPWQGQLCEEQECQLLIKTRLSCLEELERCIQQHHPYEVPEIIALPILWGHQAYLEWIEQHCTP